MQTLKRHERVVDTQALSDALIVTARFNDDNLVEVEGYGKYIRVKVVKTYPHGLSMERLEPA